MVQTTKFSKLFTKPKTTGSRLFEINFDAEQLKSPSAGAKNISDFFFLLDRLFLFIFFINNAHLPLLHYMSQSKL